MTAPRSGTATAARALRNALCVVLALLIAGCATLQDRNQRLETTLDAYAAAVRWQGVEAGWDFVDPAWRAEHPLTPQQKARYAAVRVAQYDPGQPVADGEGSVRVTAQLQVIDKASQQVRQVVDHQTWRWNAGAKRWWLASGLPDVTPER